MDPDFFTGWPTCEEEDENANLTRIFKALYGEMMDAYYADEDHKAQEIATSLLAKPNCPLYHRASAHLVMATYFDNPCIYHAKEGIRVLEEQVFVLEPDYPRDMLPEARRLLHDAEEFCRRTGQRETNVRKEDEVEEEESDGGSWHTLLFEGEEGFEEQEAREKLLKEQRKEMMQPLREGDEAEEAESEGSWHTLLFEGEEGFEEQQARDKLWKEQHEQMMQPRQEEDSEELNEKLPSGDDEEDMDLSQEL